MDKTLERIRYSMSARCVQKHIRGYLKKLRTLPNVSYNKTVLSYASINAFVISMKKQNDSNNKTRESMIGAIINNKIPESYFSSSARWKQMKIAIFGFVEQLARLQQLSQHSQHSQHSHPSYQSDTMEGISLEHKGGRKFNYDFSLIINNIEYNIELKFNATQIKEAPQFVSPVKPSQYMTDSYEDFFYDNYLPQLASLTSFGIPDRTQYMKEIHSNAPSCMKAYQDLYYQGCKASSQYTGEQNAIAFYKLANKLDKESREAFIDKVELKLDLLSDYLQESQKGKIYMLYSKGKFYKQTIDLSDYKLVKYEKDPKKYKFVIYSESGNKANVLLRWKNGNGIAFPAFQIS